MNGRKNSGSFTLEVRRATRSNEALHLTSDLRIALAAPPLLFDSLAGELER